MGIRKYKPTTPGRRGSSVADFVEITRSTPEKSLVRPLHSKGGRNNAGRVTVRHQGGGLIPPRLQFRGVQFSNHLPGFQRVALLRQNFFHAPAVARSDVDFVRVNRSRNNGRVGITSRA